jgi:hypothetical protein
MRAGPGSSVERLVDVSPDLLGRERLPPVPLHDDAVQPRRLVEDDLEKLPAQMGARSMTFRVSVDSP